MAYASHWMGGEITWECQGGGDYVFKLKVYRDCNGVPGPNAAQLSVWNHPSINTIALTLISQTDISPSCNQVAGGPAAITCGVGGPGAVEEFIFESAPITITGVPPAQGWAFTWDNFFRNAAINNLVDPDNSGITLRAVMYPFNGQNAGPCFDSSPQFAETPVTVACTGYPFRYNQNAYDPDLDSLAYSWGDPLDNLNGVFNPPVNPAAIQWEAGYSINSPLPGTTQNANNIPANMNPYTGEVSFTSFTQGNFVTVVKVESWRCGQKIAEVYREMQTVLLGCSGTNNPPVVTPPFNGGTSFADTVYAGDLVVFNFNSSDNETLQDGSQQTNILTPSGSQFGANFNDVNNGCPNPPCATLSDPIPLSGQNGIATTFSWQTDCSHVSSNNGCSAESTTHTFVFRVSDDFCPAPGVNMPTISITVLGLPQVAAPDLRCASVAPNGDVTLSWEPTTDPMGSFTNYEVFVSGSPGGPYSSITTIPNINTTSYTHVGADAHLGSVYYYVATNSGCYGGQATASDTLRTIFLEVDNPANGTAELNWNPIASPNVATSTGWYHIYQEYPVPGVWTLIDSTQYGNESYIDTISVCTDTLNYRVEIADSSGCVSASSIDGDWFSDILPPTPPLINAVSVDTLNGLATIDWDPSPEQDTEGYIVLQLIGGAWVIIDTVWGINNNFYTHLTSSVNAFSECYGLAAIDSCWSGVPSSPNTSPMGTPHCSMYLTNSLDICPQEVNLEWNSYINWPAGVLQYEIYAIENGGTPVMVGVNTPNDTNFVHTNINAYSTYCYVVKAISNDGKESLSNKSCRYIHRPLQPTFNYLSVATVTSEESIAVRIIGDPAASVSHYRIERADEQLGPYVPVGTVGSAPNPIQYTDFTPLPGEQEYYYQVVVVDSCGDDALTSNYARTMLLRVYADQNRLLNIVQWSSYRGWDGNIVAYNIYRSVSGVFDPTPIVTVPPTIQYYEDDVADLITTTADGEFCYYIEAVESFNNYGVAEISHSNTVCAYQEPKVWIPNAFIIGGVNNTFQPVAGYIDFDAYRMRIFNRWGELIFETTDIAEGWDGTYKGDVVQEGAYVYEISYRSSEGKPIDRRGTLTLLHGGSGE